MQINGTRFQFEEDAEPAKQLPLAVKYFYGKDDEKMKLVISACFANKTPRVRGKNVGRNDRERTFPGELLDYFVGCWDTSVASLSSDIPETFLPISGDMIETNGCAKWAGVAEEKLYLAASDLP